MSTADRTTDPTDTPFANHLLFDAAWAPSPRRARWALAEKGLAMPTCRLDMRAGEHLGEAALGDNPGATVPALRLPDGVLITGSVAIARYVEAVRPDPPLFGRRAADVGLVASWLERIDGEGYSQIADWLRNSRPAFAERPLPGARLAGVAQIPELAARGDTLWRRFAAGLEGVLGDGWLTGPDFTMADIALAVACDFADAVKLDWTAGERLAAWRARAAARPGASA